MSLIPAFELGLWNAWILIVPLLVTWIFTITLMLKRGEKMPQFRRRKERILSNLLTLSIFVPFIYSIFLPLKLGTAWFYVGFLIYLVGMIFIITADLAFTTTPTDKPVTKWVYHFSRNPMDVGWLLIYLGIAVSCISWIYLLFAVIAIVAMRGMAIIEEAMCLGRYGKSYREYMNRTPRWIGIPKKR